MQLSFAKTETSALKKTFVFGAVLSAVFAAIGTFVSAQTAVVVPDATFNAELAAKLPQDLRDRGALVAVMSENNPPQQFLDEATNTVVGANPDFTKALAQVLGLKYEVVATKLSNAIPGLQAGRYDVAVANMQPTEQRKEVLDFFNYQTSSNHLAVKAGNPKNISLDDLSYCGMTLTSNTGSAVEMSHIPRLQQRCIDAGKPEFTYLSLPGFPEMFNAVVSERADALAFSTLAIVWANRETQAVELAGEIAKNPLAIGVLKDSALFPVLRDAFAQLIEEGVYKKILEKWGMELMSNTSLTINDSVQ